ncbi:hypothetical protein A2U01_0073836, partial [Trifolium medium]|nr:hypothetical protein [Trifolium medium]
LSMPLDGAAVALSVLRLREARQAS